MLAMRGSQAAVCALVSSSFASALAAGCDCIGETWGAAKLQQFGLPSEYGKHCAAWEDGDCSAHTCGSKTTCDTMWPTVQHGTWCCSAWCYVDPSTCLKSDVSSSALDAGGLTAETKYYSYAACSEEPVVTLVKYTDATCPWSLDLDFSTSFSLCRSSSMSQGAPEVLLLQDLSGSFGDDVRKLNSLMDDLNTKLSAQFGELRFGVASYVDHPRLRGWSNEYCYRLAQPLTSDWSEVKTAYQGLSLMSGGDRPESQLDAIYSAAMDDSVGWSSDDNTTKIILLATDAPSHFGASRMASGTGCYSDRGYVGKATVRAALEAKGIELVFAVTNNQVEFYKKVSCELGRGQVVELSADSSNFVNAVTDGACMLSKVPKSSMWIWLGGISAADVREHVPKVIAEAVDLSPNAVVLSAMGNGHGSVDCTATIMTTGEAEAESIASKLRAIDLKQLLQDRGASVTWLESVVEAGTSFVKGRSCDATFVGAGTRSDSFMLAVSLLLWISASRV